MARARNRVESEVYSRSLLCTGVLGAYAYMGPKAGRDIFSLAPEKADLIFGVMTVITGVFGTVRKGLPNMPVAACQAAQYLTRSVDFGSGVACKRPLSISQPRVHFCY